MVQASLAWPPSLHYLPVVVPPPAAAAAGARFGTPLLPLSSSPFPPRPSIPSAVHGPRPSLFLHRLRVPGARPPLLSSPSLPRRGLSATAALPMGLLEGNLAHDVAASAFSSAVAMLLLKLWEEIAKRGVFDQKLNRKLVHISIGLAFMLFWPLFSSGVEAPFLAALPPAINIIRMFLLGYGILKNDAVVKSMSRNGDYRELRKGPLYYACTITLATTVFWRTSPIGIAAICNLCAGDGTADIIGRRFGKDKLPYNPNKSFAGTAAMAIAGFLASVLYVHYFSLFGHIKESWQLTVGLLLVSMFAAFIESLPISTKLDDNLTVPLASVLGGVLVL